MRLILSLTLILTLATAAFAQYIVVNPQTPGSRAALKHVNELIERHIPAEMRKTYVPHPDALKSWDDLRQATELLKAIPNQTREQIEHALGQPPDKLDADQLHVFAELLDQQEPVFERIDRILARGKLHIPFSLDPDAQDMELTAELHLMAQMILLQAHVYLAKDQPGEAMDSYRRALELGQVLREGLMVHYLVGTAIEALTHRQLTRIALTSGDVTALRAVMNLAAEEKPVGRSLRAACDGRERDFTINALRYLAVQFAEDQPERERFKVADLAMCPDLPSMLHYHVLDDDRKDRVRRYLLKHARLFDANATIESFATDHKQFSAAYTATYSLKEMPKGLFDLTERGELLAELVKYVTNEEQPPVEFQQKIATEFDNITGKSGELWQQRLIWIDRKRLSDRHGLRTLAALRLAESKLGQLPDKLTGLIDAGILKSLPADPFGVGPLRYDPQRRLIWSIGDNGTDDGGEGLPDDPIKRLSGKDIVWRIPPIQTTD